MTTATITLKTDTKDNWESTNRVLKENEPGFERVTIDGEDYVNMKLGDGVTPWNSLGYVWRMRNDIQINDNISTDSTTYSSQKIDNMINSAVANRARQYGVRFVGSSKEGTRLGDAVGLTASAGTDLIDAYNDFDYIMPWKCKRVNGTLDENGDFDVVAIEGEPYFSLDGTNGDVFVERPKFYYKYVFADDYFEVWICTEQLEGYQLPKRFVKSDGTVADVIYKACYKMGLDGSGNPTSVSGKNTMLTCTLGQGLAKARTLSDYYCLETTYDRQIEELLFMVEYATRDTHSVMSGASNLAYNNTEDVSTIATSDTNSIIVSNDVAKKYVIGQTIVIGSSKNGEEISDYTDGRRIVSISTYNDGNKSIVFDGDAIDSIPVGSFLSSRCWYSGGSDDVLSPSGQCGNLNDGKHQCRYRYIEDLWGNQWSWLCDVLIFNYQTYVCDDDAIRYIASDPRENAYYKAVDYTNSNGAGYIKELGYDEDYPYVRITTVVGGSSATYFCDYYSPGSGLRALRVGGYIITSGGLLTQSAAYDPTDSFWSIGCRLSYFA